MKQQHTPCVGISSEEAFNVAIAEELIREIDPDATPASIAKVWQACNGNPWNAPFLYSILHPGEAS